MSCDLSRIDSWSTGKLSPRLIENLPEWAQQRGIQHVVWTDLPARFNDEDHLVPSEDEVILYLKGLEGEKRKLAERYIRRAPRQTETVYRRRIEAEFGWTPLDGDE